jgi:hypothetical protein
MRRRHSCSPPPLSSTRAREHCCDGGCAGCGGEPAARGVGGGFLSRHLIDCFDGGIFSVRAIHIFDIERCLVFIFMRLLTNEVEERV